jgi:hypothetical protein
MSERCTIDTLLRAFEPVIEQLPDHRTGRNVTYTIQDAVFSAFAVFFMQAPSFLAQQQVVERQRGRNNAQTLFGVTQIPSDNQIRNLLDPLPPERLFLLFETGWQILQAAGALTSFQTLDQQYLIALDGTQYFSSQQVHCDACMHTTSANGVTTYSHTVLLPVLVAPEQSQVVTLAPEFIAPQDGHDKQDCEHAAAKRWLTRAGPTFAPQTVTLLGDDLYSHQPFCEMALAQQFNFILVCKPNSHETLSKWVNTLAALGGVSGLTQRHWNGRFGEIWTYRYVNDVPLRAEAELLHVNWCELTITDERDGRLLYHNAFVTNHPISDDTVAAIVAAGRTRWKVENEGNNTLKTKGYHFEHNYGHGQQHLAAFLLTLILLAFLCHTLLDLLNTKYQLLRQALAARRTFFDDLRALTRYWVFDTWDQLFDFMLRGLELALPPPRPVQPELHHACYLDPHCLIGARSIT